MSCAAPGRAEPTGGGSGFGRGSGAPAAPVATSPGRALSDSPREPSPLAASLASALRCALADAGSARSILVAARGRHGPRRLEPQREHLAGHHAEPVRYIGVRLIVSGDFPAVGAGVEKSDQRTAVPAEINPVVAGLASHTAASIPQTRARSDRRARKTAPVRISRTVRQPPRPLPSHPYGSGCPKRRGAGERLHTTRPRFASKLVAA